MLFMMGVKGIPSLWILGNPYSLGGLVPVGFKRLKMSSGRFAFLSRSVVFCSTASVGFLVSFL